MTAMSAAKTKLKKRSKPRVVWVVFCNSEDEEDSNVFESKAKAESAAKRWDISFDYLAPHVVVKYVREVKRRGNAVNEVKNWDKKKRDTLSAIYEARQKAQRNDN